jgi:hypothetical protein
MSGCMGHMATPEITSRHSTKEGEGGTEASPSDPTMHPGMA